MTPSGEGGSKAPRGAGQGFQFRVLCGTHACPVARSMLLLTSMKGSIADTPPRATKRSSETLAQQSPRSNLSKASEILPACGQGAGHRCPDADGAHSSTVCQGFLKNVTEARAQRFVQVSTEPAGDPHGAEHHGLHADLDAGAAQVAHVSDPFMSRRVLLH